MQPNDGVPFQFGRDWINAGVLYAAGDKCVLPAHDADKLERLGAGKRSNRPKAAPKQTTTED
jgi:hypothetical protein